MNKIDKEQFKELWNLRLTCKEIADFFQVSIPYIGQIRTKLNLPPRHIGFYFVHHPNEKPMSLVKILERVTNSDCGVPVSDIQQNYSSLLQLVLGFYKIDLSSKRGEGGWKGRSWTSIFYDNFREKRFICSTRTQMIRLAVKACKTPTNREERYSLTVFLRRYFSEAEIVAILWQKGIHKFYKTRKRSIKIDGVYHPISHRDINSQWKGWEY